MANPRVRIDSKAARELLKSAEVQADLMRRARRVAGAAGPGHVVSVEVGPKRARAEVRTGTAAARRAEAERKSLTSALDAGRLE